MSENGQNGTQGFGVNVWWTCPETIVDGVVAQNAVRNHGFKKDELKLPTRKEEVRRAADALHNRRVKAGRKITEKCSDGAEFAVWGILEKGQVDAEEVAYNQTTTVKLEKASGNVSVEGPLADAVMIALSEYEGSITDDDIRAFMRRVIRRGFGIAKRPTGGIYFVPAKYAPLVTAAQAALSEMGTNARIYVERVMDGSAERQNVWGSVVEEVEARIGETLDAVERIEKRASAVKSQKAKLIELNGLVDVYRNLLGEEAKYEDLTAKLESAVQKVSEKMAEIQHQVARAA